MAGLAEEVTNIDNTEAKRRIEKQVLEANVVAISLQQIFLLQTILPQLFCSKTLRMKKYAKKKNGDAQVRELYGWTQEEVAVYLGMSRSHLSLHEIGERLLPAGTGLRWLEWVQFTHVDGALKKAKFIRLTIPTIRFTLMTDRFLLK